MLRFDKRQQNSVKQLSFNKNNKLKTKKIKMLTGLVIILNKIWDHPISNTVLKHIKILWKFLWERLLNFSRLSQRIQESPKLMYIEHENEESGKILSCYLITKVRVSEVMDICQS